MGPARSPSVSGKLTGPVVGPEGNVFVGCSDGKLYGFTPVGLPLSPTPSMVVGDGSATGGIVDPPLIDEVNRYLYAVSGNSSPGKSVVVQAKTADLSLQVTATLDTGGANNLHLPAFNDAYFSSGTSSDWLLYEYSSAAGSPGSITIWGIGFTGLHVMNANTPANSRVFAIGAFEVSPLTEFFNGGVDSIFLSDITIGTAVGASIDQVHHHRWVPALARKRYSLS